MAFIVLDVEGTADNSVYDFGFVVIDHNEVVETYNAIIAEVWNDKARMNSAYYADKLPRYGEVHPVPFIEAWNVFNTAIKSYNIRTVWAWNVSYDETALNNTIARLSNGFINKFCPTVKWRDAWDYVAACYCSTRKYAAWTVNNDFLTPRNYPRTSAETVYRYLFGDISFNEDHMALSDALIESQMIMKALKCHTKGVQTRGRGWTYTVRQA